MPIFTYNLSWIALNICLAFIPVALVMILRQRMPFFLRAILILLWLLFLPNTIYLVTDLQWFPGQLLATQMPEQAALFVQYIFLTFIGIFTYFFSMEPMSIILEKMRSSRMNKVVLYVMLNFIISYAVVLGKVQRTHSIYLFTDFERVVRDMLATFTSSSLMLWVLLVGIMINTIFFAGRKYFSKMLGQKREL